METTPESNVLLVGAGGLGCEIVRSLVVQGAERITIVDPDTIEVHNLSRQLLYRHDDVGKYKAQVAAQRIREHHRQVKVDSIATGIQEVPLETIAKFDVVVSAVDNVEARRWINLATMVIWEQRMNGGTSEAGEAVVRPLLVDGGSQELYGHVRVVSGRDQPCLECSMPLFSNKVRKRRRVGVGHVHQADEPSCSVPRKPRTPEDCVSKCKAGSQTWQGLSGYVISEKFSEYFGEEGRGIPDHEIVERIREDAVGYAKLSGIGAVTREVVRRVVNNQPINVVTTNAIVAAIVARVVLTRDAAKNFYFYSGDGSTVFDAFNMEKQQIIDEQIRASGAGRGAAVTGRRISQTGASTRPGRRRRCAPGEEWAVELQRGRVDVAGRYLDHGHRQQPLKRVAAGGLVGLDENLPHLGHAALNHDLAVAVAVLQLEVLPHELGVVEQLVAQTAAEPLGAVDQGVDVAELLPLLLNVGFVLTVLGRLQVAAQEVLGEGLDVAQPLELGLGDLAGGHELLLPAAGLRLGDDLALLAALPRGVLHGDVVAGHAGLPLVDVVAHVDAHVAGAAEVPEVNVALAFLTQNSGLTRM
ncbi:ubiquitin-activating enzyme E1 C [Babesia caballi]|uniref:NEDD8-activating enzyme E1 catalytic subunit n=1 Tax=Babesia caballi TaxID=5871 RepID=A0AAV4LRD0_BABCB|nr:ubiquitin-activating enzyme E1 C [Babesia caballi]